MCDFCINKDLMYICTVLCFNSTPPLSLSYCLILELDAFEMFLYGMLTFMSCISLLLYLEQSVYIYRKMSYPKKTTIIWISGAAPVSSESNRNA